MSPSWRARGSMSRPGGVPKSSSQRWLARRDTCPALDAGAGPLNDSVQRLTPPARRLAPAAAASCFRPRHVIAVRVIEPDLLAAVDGDGESEPG